MSQYSHLFRGKTGHTANPTIPKPEAKEHAVTEALTHEIPKHIRPIEEKPLIPHKKPHYNMLYGSLGEEGSYRYEIDNFAVGTLTSTPGGTVGTAVKLALAQNWKLDQWPGATNMFLVLRRFSMAPQTNFNTPQPVEVSVPAVAGPTTLFTGKGVLNSIEVTTAGTVALTFQDGAGNIIDTVPAAAPVGTIRNPNQAFNTSLVANNLTTTGVVTVTYTPDANVLGAIDVQFVDFGGQVIPLGDFLSNANTLQDMAIIIPTSITDPQNLNVGTLNVALNAGALASVYNWQLAFSAAYLIPALKGYAMELPSEEFYHEKYLHQPIHH